MGLVDLLLRRRKRVGKTTKDIGTELEERVVDLYRRLGYFQVKRSVLVRDTFGNLSEIDVRAGILFRRYVECKNYSETHPVPFSDVAKFKSVLELNDIPIQKGVFVTTSTFTPRCRTIGIKCIDGKELVRLERWSVVKNMLNKVIRTSAVLSVATVGAYLYSYPVRWDKINSWYDVEAEFSKAHKVISAWRRRISREMSDLFKSRD